MYHKYAIKLSPVRNTEWSEFKGILQLILSIFKGKQN